jgi:hypothetical protein
MAGNPNSVSGRRTRSSYQYTMLNCPHHLDQPLKVKLLGLGRRNFLEMRGNERLWGRPEVWQSYFPIRPIQGPDLQEY